MIYVVMSDGRIRVPTDVHTTIYDEIKFTLDNKLYRYCKTASEIGFEARKYITSNRYFTMWHNHQWLYTADIAYLYQIKEEEDTELNYFESTDFNAGVIYNKVEKAFAPALKDTSLQEIEGYATLPTIQVLPKIILPGVTEEEIINATCKSVIAHFDAVYGKQFTLCFPDCKHDKQYIKFKYIVKRKNAYKEMTVEEIEAALGYKIKVVGNK